MILKIPFINQKKILKVTKLQKNNNNFYLKHSFFEDDEKLLFKQLDI